MRGLRRFRLPCPTCGGKRVLPLDPGGKDKLECPTCWAEGSILIEETRYGPAERPRRALTTDQVVDFSEVLVPKVVG